jgi:hypothetical protein
MVSLKMNAQASRRIYDPPVDPRTLSPREDGTLAQVVSHLQRILGEEHHSTISAKNNLANMLGDQGTLEEAAVISGEVVSRMQRILGPMHPWTLVARNNLTRIL